MAKVVVNWPQNKHFCLGNQNLIQSGKINKKCFGLVVFVNNSHACLETLSEISIIDRLVCTGYLWTVFTGASKQAIRNPVHVSSEPQQIDLNFVVKLQYIVAIYPYRTICHGVLEITIALARVLDYVTLQTFSIVSWSIIILISKITYGMWKEQPDLKPEPAVSKKISR